MRHSHSISWCNLCDAFADFDDFTGGVESDEARKLCDDDSELLYLPVCGRQPNRFDLHQDLPWPNLWRREGWVNDERRELGRNNESFVGLGGHWYC